MPRHHHAAAYPYSIVEIEHRPMKANFRRWLYALVVLLTVMAVLYLSGWIYNVMRAAGDVLALYFFAWLLQFFFTPVVDFMARRGVSRVIAVTWVYLALGLGAGIAMAAAAPAIYSQGQRLAQELANPHTYVVISNVTRGVESFIQTHFNVPRSEIQSFTQNYSVSLRNGAVKAGAKLQQLIDSRLTPGNLSNSATTFLTFLGMLNALFLNIVIVLILAFYMMLDGHKLVREALAYFPPAVDEIMESVHLTINRKFGGYLRGQFIIAFTYAVLTYVICLGFNLNYPLLIAIVSGVLMLIPFVGAFASVVPPLIGYVLVHATDASFSFGHLILLLAFLATVQHIVINVLAPRVMSSAMGMHPLLVMLGLLIGTKMGGLWGAIFGVPILGVILDTVDHIYRQVIRRQQGAGAQAAERGPAGARAAPRPPVRAAGVVTVRRRPPPAAGEPRLRRLK